MGISALSGVTGYVIEVTAVVQSQSQSGNYSIIKWTRRVRREGSSFHWGQWSANSMKVWREPTDATLRDDNGFAYDFRGTAPVEDLYAEGTYRLNHDANGYAEYEVKGNVYMIFRASNGSTFSVSGQATSGVKTATRIPKVPSAPGKPSFSEVGPTSVKVSWTAPTSDGGDSIDSYLLQYWDNPAGTGDHTDIVVSGTTRSRVVTGLLPGKTYRFKVHAKNGVGYSPASAHNTVQLLAGARILVDGVWKMAIPYVNVDGVWKMAMPFVRNNDVWKIGV